MQHLKSGVTQTARLPSFLLSLLLLPPYRVISLIKAFIMRKQQVTLLPKRALLPAASLCTEKINPSGNNVRVTNNRLSFHLLHKYHKFFL